MRNLSALLITPALLALASPARAEAPAFAPPGRGQPGLAVGSDGQGVLRAKLCDKAPCSVEGGVALAVPPALAAQVPRARLAIVGLGSGRRAVVVTVPGAPQSFQAVVVAPLQGTTPKVVFSGLTGVVEGADGVRAGRTVSISEPDEAGGRRVLIGTLREDLELCGRPAVLSPELLAPEDLRLKPAKVQRLTAEERERAATLVATPAGVASDASGGRALAALGASSALGAPQALTDGRLETAWTENRGGSGRGEFVVMSAPPNLPIAGFDLVLTAPKSKPEPANVPRELWLVTRKGVYHVRLPDSAATDPGLRFRVTLPKPELTDCAALVLESAFTERADAKVSVSELAVASEFEDATPAALVAALAGGGERALAAAAVLRGLGAPGFEELARRFTSLDEGGRRVALDVLDSAPCETSVPAYLSAFSSHLEAQRLHAEARLRRCGAVSAEGLAKLVQSSEGELLTRSANELVLAAPERAVAESVTRLSGRLNAGDRHALRVALARASRVPAAEPRVRSALGNPGTAARAALDLLRALGAAAPKFMPESGEALARLAKDPSFATRYLVLAPAAALAAEDARADALLERALGPQPEPDTFLRVRALEVAPRDAKRAPLFVRALADANVRVREAAARALGEGRLQAGAPGLAKLLDEDAWPLARRQAASALGALPPDPQGDDALLGALGDAAPQVRSEAASALGARQVKRAAGALRDHLEDPAEKLEVRAASAAALGALCDRESESDLAKLARRVNDPLATPEERALGEASLAALVRLSPKNLPEILEPIRQGAGKKAVEGALARGQGKRCR